MERNFHRRRYLMESKRNGSLTVTAIIFVSIVIIFVVLQCVVFTSKLDVIEEITNSYLN